MKLVLVSLDALFDQDLKILDKNTFIGQWLEHASGCTEVKTVYPALTYPAHTTLVTGCDPVDHGIGQNQPHQPEIAAENRAWYWKTSDIKKPSLFDAAKKAGWKCGSVLWPVTGKSKSIKWNFPEVIALPGENQVMKMLSYGTPVWILTMEFKHGKDRVSTKEPHLSDYGALLTCELISKKKPDLTALHMVDLDEMRHHHGTDSKEAQEAILRLDGRVKKIWEVLQSTEGMEDAVLCLVSDHGQEDVTRTVNLGEAIEQTEFKNLCSIQSNGMGAYVFFTEDNAETREKLAAWLKENAEKLGVSKVYEDADLRAMGAVKTVKLAVEAAEGVVFSDGLPQAKREKATHGFGPGRGAENCLFAVRGKNIKEGVWLPAMPMRDVAPTLAELVGLSLPTATGTDHSKELLK